MGKNKYSKNAFTVLEMLVTLLIIGIVAAFSIPNFQKFVLRSRVTTMYEAASAAQFVVTNDYYNQSAFTSYAAKSTPFTTPRSPYIDPTNGIAITNGVITITGVASKLFNNQINLTITPTVDPQTQQITWRCCVGNADFYDFVPADCRC